MRVAHRHNKIVLLLKRLPSRAFPFGCWSAGRHSRNVIGLTLFDRGFF